MRCKKWLELAQTTSCRGVTARSREMVIKQRIVGFRLQLQGQDNCSSKSLSLPVSDKHTQTALKDLLCAGCPVAGLQISFPDSDSRDDGSSDVVLSHIGPTSKNRELLIKVDHTPSRLCFYAWANKMARRSICSCEQTRQVIKHIYTINNEVCGTQSKFVLNSGASVIKL